MTDISSTSKDFSPTIATIKSKMELNKKIKERLVSLSDGEYRRFMIKLLPTVDENTVLGVRMGNLKALAKNVLKENTKEEILFFLRELPHEYYEENMLHVIILSDIKDFDECIREIDRFLPKIDNWGTCDSLRPKCFAKNHGRLLEKINRDWLPSSLSYTKRFAIEMLMIHFLDEDFSPEMLDDVAEIRSEEYYLNMMVAWYFATALAKQYDATLPYLTEHRLDAWTHNKTIQKAVESYRIDKDKKEFLRSLRIKKK